MCVFNGKLTVENSKRYGQGYYRSPIGSGILAFK